jgi:hypothetical protein
MIKEAGLKLLIAGILTSVLPLLGLAILLFTGLEAFAGMALFLYIALPCLFFSLVLFVAGIIININKNGSLFYVKSKFNSAIKVFCIIEIIAIVLAAIFLLS